MSEGTEVGRGKIRDRIKERILRRFAERLNDAVESGRLTREEADAYIEDLNVKAGEIDWLKLIELVMQILMMIFGGGFFL
jgi:hypothetical protein